MANKKQKNQIVVAGIVIAIVLVLIFFRTDSPLSVAYQGQCSLPSCPSGYSIQEKSCSGKSCFGVCEKQVPAYCGSYGSTKSLGKNIIFDRTDNGDSFSASQIYQSSNLCYKFRATGSLRITNDDPGGFLNRNSESHKLSYGGIGISESVCSTSSSFSDESDWKTIGRGRSGSSAGAWGRYTAYKDENCGSVAYGSEGSLFFQLQYQEAPWIDDEVITTTVDCSFECSSNSDCGSTGFTGSKRCSGGNVVQDYESNSCSSFKCISSDEEKIVDFCDFGCELGSCIQRNLVDYYRLSNNQCNLIQIYESDKTFNDYSSLSECQSKIQEQDILVYRLDDNCNSAYIKVSQRTANDYDSRAECMSQVNQKVKYYRLEDNKCSEIIIYPSDKTSEDYNTLVECKNKIDDDPPIVENLIELIFGGITILLLIIVLIVWLIRRK